MRIILVSGENLYILVLNNAVIGAYPSLDALYKANFTD